MAALLALAAPASAAVRYASPTSSDSAGACASALTACTLTHAVNAAASGGEIVVAPGAYNVTTTLALPGGSFIHGVAGSARPVIRSTVAGSALTTTSPGSSHLKDLEIDGPSTNGLVFLNGDGALVENLVLHDEAANGTALAEYGVSGVTTVRDTIATAAGTGSTAMWFGGQVAHVRNVTAWATGAGSSGLESYDNFFVIPPNCFGQGRGQVDLVSSIVHGDGTDLQLTKAGSCGIAPSLAVSWSAFTTKGEVGGTIDSSGGHNVSMVPAAVFVAPGTDFHELAGAATIDAGLADANTGTQDVDGLARARGTVDMGAAEYFAPDVAILTSTAGPTFVGAVNPRGLETTAVFEFGPDTSYGSTAGQVTIAADDAIHGVSVAPPGLNPATGYHVRLQASQGNANYTRTVKSADGIYTPPAVTAAPPPAAAVPVVKQRLRCKVPKLKGLTRKGARKRLARAHCAIGKVRGRKGGRVRSQSKKAGRFLAAGTKVSVRLA